MVIFGVPRKYKAQIYSVPKKGDIYGNNY